MFDTVLPEKCYKNFCKLVQGVRIVMQRRITGAQVQEAHSCLVQFVKEFKLCNIKDAWIDCTLHDHSSTLFCMLWQRFPKLEQSQHIRVYNEAYDWRTWQGYPTTVESIC